MKKENNATRSSSSKHADQARYHNFSKKQKRRHAQKNAESQKVEHNNREKLFFEKATTARVVIVSDRDARAKHGSCLVAVLFFLRFASYAQIVKC